MAEGVGPESNVLYVLNICFDEYSSGCTGSQVGPLIAAKPIDLMREIGSLRERGYNDRQIGEKIGVSYEYVAVDGLRADPVF
ncbi:hypothetical protein [Sagittula salina]|uniref:hypothetical protein n=1 Tax=Sagittula salina TaxID=2820268 RepID=UPI001FD7D14E|nr:hypothetical protein [Sagittula salina]